MSNHRMPSLAVAASAVGLSLLLSPSTAMAVGEAVGGFPNWQERVLHQWMNRARAAPAMDLANCTAGSCGDSGCYMPIAPLPWNLKLGRAARFHSDEMQKQGYPSLDHNSECTIVSNIDSLYPTTCDGSAACACTTGMRQCSPTCQDFSARVALFGSSTSGEIIAGGTDPNSAFYLWLYEKATNTACSYSSDKGHRWNILKAGPSVGTGVSSGPLYGGTSVGDFGPGGTMTKLVSGTHYPQRGAQVEVWASWYDTAGGPSQQIVNVDGACTSMSLKRGSDTNGAWSAMLSGLNTATCHRYYFMWKDKAGADVTYPTTGSLGIGPAGCADFSTARPGACGCTPKCSGLSCGDDGCGGTCGTCSGSATCQAGICMGPASGDGGTTDPTADGGLTTDGQVDAGCSCELGGRSGGPAVSTLAGLFALGGLLLARRRRQRHGRDVA